MALKVVITDCPWEDNSVEREILQEVGAEVTRAQCRTPEEVISVARDADALLVGWAPITRAVVSELRRCRLMVRYGAGYDNIDVPAATAAGIGVTNNPDYCVEEVATHALALLLALHRQLASLIAGVKAGGWNPRTMMTPMPRLTTQTVGVVGLGRIGSRFAECVRPLVHQVLVCDPLVEVRETNNPRFQFVSFDRLLRESDYISVHVPLTEDTRHLFSRQTLAKMKPTAYLINVARGPVVDEEALATAIREKRLAGAALDVFVLEPLPLDHPLRGLPNVLLTPHAAAYSQHADHLLHSNPARAIVRFFKGEQIPLLNNPILKPPA